MKRRLEKKGWSPKHISEAENILALSKVRKHPHIKKVEDSMFWFTLVTSILGTILLSIALIPILIIMNKVHAYIIVGLFGLLLGMMIKYISVRMHWLEQHHKVSLSSIAPVLGLFNMFIVASMVNSFNQFARIDNFHNPAIIGVTYFIAFILPHIFWRK